MFYYLCNSLIGKKPNLSVKTILMVISYGLAIGTITLGLDGYMARVLINIALLLIIKYITSRKIQDVVIIFAIIFLCTVLIQALGLQLTNSLGLEMNTDCTFLLVQMFTTTITLFICKKVPLYKLYNIIEKEILLKLLIISLAVILLITLFYINFEYTTSYILYFSILIIISFGGLYQTLKKVFYYTNKIPMQLHDINNLLMGIKLSVYSTSDINVVRDEIDKALGIIDIDTDIEGIDMNDYNQIILSFIELKKRKVVNNEPSFFADIGYYESNAKVAFSVILYMLGVLLDNAIESGTKKEIIIKVYVIEENLYLSVSNEYKKKSFDDFEKMFKERYSTKGEMNSRGYGLPNLSKVVTSYGGNILLKEEYNKEQKSDYIIITIDIK